VVAADMAKNGKNLIKIVPAPRLIGIHPNPGPAGRRELTDEEKWKIVIRWKDDKKCMHAIAKELNVSRRVVQRLVQKYQQTHSVERRSGQGRKRKLNSATQRNMVKKAKSGKCAPAIMRSYNLNKESKTETISERTVHRALRSKGLKYMSVTQRETLTSTQIRNRLAYACERLNFNWKIVLFTDEKTFPLGAAEARAWQDPKDRKTRPKLVHPTKLHVWGGIGHYFKTKLYFFQQNLDGKLYREILKNRIPPYFSPDCPSEIRGDWVFLQDNDPKHKAKLTLEYLDEIAWDRIQDHPANSADLNIMEDAWSYLDQEVKKKRSSRSTS